MTREFCVGEAHAAQLLMVLRLLSVPCEQVLAHDCAAQAGSRTISSNATYVSDSLSNLVSCPFDLIDTNSINEVSGGVCPPFGTMLWILLRFINSLTS